MPEIIESEKYVTQIPRFVLPKEFSNEAPEVKPESKPEVKPADAPEKVQESPVKGEAAEAAAPEKEPETPSEETTEKDPEKATTRRFERRIDRAHKRAAEAQARAEFLEKQIAELKAQSTPQKSSAAPRMEDFTDVQEYAKAFANYESEQKLREYQRKQQEDHQKAQVSKLTEEWESQVSKASNKYDDWDEVVGELKPTTPWSIAIMRTKNGADIAHYLGTHTAEAKEIMALDPYSQILEIGKLSVKLSAPVEKPKTPSKAPAPIKPVQTESKASSDEIRPDQPFEEYLKVGRKLFRGR